MAGFQEMATRINDLTGVVEKLKTTMVDQDPITMGLYPPWELLCLVFVCIKPKRILRVVF